MNQARSSIDGILTDDERNYFTYVCHRAPSWKQLLSILFGILGSSAMIAFGAITSDSKVLLALDHLLLFIWIIVLLVVFKKSIGISSGLVGKYESFIDELSKRGLPP